MKMQTTDTRTLGPNNLIRSPSNLREGVEKYSQADRFLGIVDTLTRTYGGTLDPSGLQLVFQAEEKTVVVRFSPIDSKVRFYADVGLPAPADQLQVYRSALEHDLLHGSQSVVIGIHPQSDRIVANYVSPLPQVGEFDTKEVMASLFQSVYRMRSRFSFFAE